ncbi:transposase [Cellulosilyticum ruminicola]|uniref:transposase n=1 Tax=Cellulosilyticum ruminicola TaxID=425254 RepID=UPI0006CF25CE|nr:transposase [Cellulosilyticum ruminicola]
MFRKNTVQQLNLQDLTVNVLVGLHILKENFSVSDEDLIGALNFDMRFQFALGTTSYEKQPVSL